jgi:hypothetical protein
MLIDMRGVEQLELLLEPRGKLLQVVQICTLARVARGRRNGGQSKRVEVGTVQHMLHGWLIVNVRRSDMAASSFGL